MKTRLNPLESRVHNSPTPEEIRREVAVIKNCRRLFDESAVWIRGSYPERRGNSRGCADTIRPALAAVCWGWSPINFRRLIPAGFRAEEASGSHGSLAGAHSAEGATAVESKERASADCKVQRLLPLAVSLVAILLATIFACTAFAQIPAKRYNPDFASSNPYGLIDLDNLAVGSYGYCKWGNLMSENSETLAYTPLTQFKDELFMNSGKSILSPHSPEYFGYQQDPANRRFVWPDSGLTYNGRTFPANYALMRKLHFPNSITTYSQSAQSVPLSSANKKLIILIHGWNSKSNSNSYDNAEFNALVTALYLKIQNTEWRLALYRWEADADTGRADIGSALHGSEAAEIAHQHGQHLGELVDRLTQQQVTKVQFIAHSAGSWAARSATEYLLSARAYSPGAPPIQIQLTLLDPFIPGVFNYFNIVVGFNHSSLTTQAMSGINWFHGANANSLYLLENYYAVDKTPGDDPDGGFTWATQEVFDWRKGQDINQQVDWDPVKGIVGDLYGVNQYYDSHVGPIQFYADTITYSDYAVLPPNDADGLKKPDFDLSKHGWKGSMFYKEQHGAAPLPSPHIASITPPSFTGSASSVPLTITGSGFTAASTLTFTKGGNPYSSGSRPTFIRADELRYAVNVGTSSASWKVKVLNGTVESNEASFEVTATPQPPGSLAPGNLRSLSSNWISGQTVVLDWDAPSASTGFSKVWVKQGSAPISTTDGLSYPLPANKPLALVLSKTSGTQAIYLWLQDGEGRKDLNAVASLSVSIDGTPPQIMVQGASSVSTQQSYIALSGTYSDAESGVKSIKWSTNFGASIAAATSGTPVIGAWSIPSVPIVAGVNRINVVALDNSGNQALAQVVVTGLDGVTNSGTIVVTITPESVRSVGAKWRFAGEVSWHNSGDIVNSYMGTRMINFSPVDGWTPPPDNYVTVYAGQTTPLSVDYTVPVSSQPPYSPSNPYPENGAGNVSRNSLTLSWLGGSPNGTVTYALALDTTPSVSISTASVDGTSAGYGAINGSSFPLLPTLQPAKTYYWRVYAKDHNGLVTEGPVWSFTTQYAIPDLVPSNLSIDGNISPGSTVTAHITVTNQGSFTAQGAYVKLYLSRTPRGKEAQLNPVHFLYLPTTLAPGQSVTLSGQVTLNNLQTGQSFIDAWIDSSLWGASAESDYNNNTTSLAVSYIDGTSPTVSNFAPQNAFAKTGAAMTLVAHASDDDSIKTLDFYYSVDGGTTWTPIQEGYVPATSMANGITYSWTVPATLPVGGNLTVRVVATDPSGNFGEKIAGPYLIHSGTAPTVTVLSPNGGELWNMGSQQQISWNLSAPNGVSQFSVLFYHDNMIDFLPVSLPSGNGTYTWTLPAALSTTTGKIRIQVQDLNGNVAEDYSDGFFSIRDTSSPPPVPWTLPLPVGTGASSSFTKVITDQAGNLHLIYGTPTGFQYTKKTGATWSNPANVAAVTGGISTLNMAVDSHGHPHLVWNNSVSAIADQNKQDVFYASFNGTSWGGPQNLSSTVVGNYNVNTLTWSSAPSLPLAAYDTASCVIDGKLYVLSGSALYEFNPSTGGWRTKTAMPGGGSSPRAIGVNGKMYVLMNGYYDYVSLRIYNPVADSWTTGASMPTPRGGVSLASINGMIYAIGGTTSASSAKNEMYNPASDTWTSKADMPTARNYAAAAAVGNSIYVIGGEKDGGLGLNTIEVYDPGSNTWGAPNMPGGADWPRRTGAVAYALNNKIYLCGGRYWDYLNTVDEYDPASNSYQSMTPMQSSRAYASGGMIGNNIYVVGGLDGNNSIATMEKASISSSPVGAISGAPAIAIDSNDTVHVVWSDGSFLVPDGNSGLGFSVTGTNVLYYVSKASGQGWSGLTQLTSTSGHRPALCVDRSNTLHVSFIGYLSNVDTVCYMKSIGGVWSIPKAITTEIDSLRMSVDSSNHLHLVGRHYNSTSGLSEISYIYSDGVSADPNQVIYSSRYATHPTIGTDSLGRPHATWEDQNYPSLLLYSFKSGNSWSSPVRLNFTSKPVVGNSSDAALSSISDELHAVWISTDNGTPQVLYNHAYVGSTNDIFVPSVSVSTPASGQTLSIGSSFSIQWNATDNTGVTSVSIDYRANNDSSWTSVATNQPNSGTFVWRVPNLGTNAGQVRVTARDAAGNSGVGFSGAFTTTDLTPPTITITTPANGATLTGDATNNVVWTATDNATVARIDLEYSLNNGASWSDMATNLTNGGSYPWVTPNSATTVLLIRATAHDTAGLSASATTQPFTIVRANSPPMAPQNPFPLNTAANVGVASPMLQWSSGDADGDPLIHTIRFGTDTTSWQTFLTSASSYTLATLQPNTTYVWQVVASDGTATSQSPVWSFTTQVDTDPTLPGDLNDDGVVTMADAIIALRVMAGVQPSGLRSDYTTSGVDVNGDGKLGMSELLYILQKIAGAR